MSLFQTDYCFVCDEPVIPAFKWEAIFFGLPKKRICEKCEKQFHRVTPPTCPVCSRPLKKLEPRFIKDGFCTDCHRWESSSKWKGVLQKNISLFEYNDFFAEILAKFKYRGDYAIAQIFADDLRQVLSKLTYDVLVPIPLSNERLYERGFNQAEALAIEAKADPVRLLTRIHSEKQSKKKRAERIHLEQIFQMANPAIDLTGQTIVLIDDVYTTGSTLRHAAYELKHAGADNVLSVTIARG